MKKETNRAVGNHGPFSSEKIESLAPIQAARTEGAAFDRLTRTIYVAAADANEPAPSVHVERIDDREGCRSLWRVDVDLGSSGETQRRGIKDEGIDAARTDAPARRQSAEQRSIDGYRPPHLPATFIPVIQAPQGSTEYEFRGRHYRPLYVIGADDRNVLFDTAFPWLCVGKIVTSDGNSASAALVGGRTVLTARHVRPVRSIAAGNWWMKFIPHSFDGSEPFGSSFISDNHYYKPTGDVGFDLAHDVMVCRLFEPLGDRLGFLGAQSYDDDWDDEGVWASVGYPADLAGGARPFVEVFASIEDSEDYGNGQYLETEADLTPGNSGGPFFAWFETSHGPSTRIVGVVSAEADFGTDFGLFQTHDHDNGLAGGNAMVELVIWARENWK